MGVEDAVDRLYRDKVILAPMVRAVSATKLVILRDCHATACCFTSDQLLSVTFNCFCSAGCRHDSNCMNVCACLPRAAVCAMCARSEI